MALVSFKLLARLLSLIQGGFQCLGWIGITRRLLKMLIPCPLQGKSHYLGLDWGQEICILANASCIFSVIRTFDKQRPSSNPDQSPASIYPCCLTHGVVFNPVTTFPCCFKGCVFKRIYSCFFSLSHCFDNLPGFAIPSWTEDLNSKSSQGRQFIFPTRYFWESSGVLLMMMPG